MQRVVPGGNAANHTHRGVLHLGVAGLFGKRVVGQQFQVALGHCSRHAGLDRRGQFDGHAHFPANGLGNFRGALFQPCMQLFQHLDSLFQGAFRPAFESGIRGGNGLFHFIRASGGNASNHVACARFVNVDHVTGPAHPLAVDVVPVQLVHASPFIQIR